MPRLRENERNQLIGMIRGGVSVSTVAHHFNVTRYVTLQRERATGSQKDRPRCLGRRKTTDREDTFMRLSLLRDRFKTAGQTTAEINNIRQNNPISKWTVLRRLKTFGLRARRPACRTRLTPYNIRNSLIGQEYIHFGLVRYGITTCFPMNPSFFWNVKMGENAYSGE
ncbi:transposable element Tc1 transposase [Elysia marginata]|uniref:Transposable element Tc1 transposase n=1 Tax=Elysia marginata TaxID=1093978 RepID=A0AAV4IYN1_9GAST|nr:transposable element Tc1 transposase [Elysia marginata]